MTAPVEAALSATGSTPTFRVAGGRLNIFISGTFSATVQVQRRPATSAASAWVPVAKNGTVLSYTAPATEMLDEVESDMDYRLTCTAYTSGTINARLSQ